nr:molybdopterin molybdenumtransferase-like [Nerophis lumbriciformis]
MLSPEQAWSLIDPHLQRLTAEESSLQAALGRRLASPLFATMDLPQADVSAMDGYCCQGAVEAGRALPVVGTSAAGAPPDFTVELGQAAKIMTGAVLPKGADRVIPVELSNGGSEQAEFTTAPKAGAHIRRQGEVLRQGEPLLASGAHLTPGALSLLAAHGHQSIPTFRRPRVAVLCTGDEIVPSDQQPGPGQLRDSNSPFLLAAGRSLGLEFDFLGIAPDQPEALGRLVRQGLKADVLLLSGGSIDGRLFDKVKIQPGKPLVAARHQAGWVFGLPGNPASVMATFWLFVRPVLRRLQGHPDSFWHGALRAQLSAPLPANKARDRFLAATLETCDGQLLATPHLPRGSHDVAAYGHGSALLRLRPGAEAAPTGDAVEVLPLVG